MKSSYSSTVILALALIILQMSSIVLADADDENTTTSAFPTMAPSSYNETPCMDTPGWQPFQSFQGCDDDSLLCMNAEVRENCCKCRPQCCGQCNTTTTTSVNGTADCEQITMVETAAPAVPSSMTPTASPTNYYEGYQGNPINGRFFVFFGLFFALMLGLKSTQYRNRRRLARYRAAHQERIRQAALRQQVDPEGAAEAYAQRQECMLSKFYFQAVLPDKSNVNPESLKLSPETTNSIIQKEMNDMEAAEQDLPVTEECKTSTFREVISCWTSSSPRDECCICLDGYMPGQTICMAKTPSCEHLFHRDCVLQWMRTNDLCPLCRNNLIE